MNIKLRKLLVACGMISLLAPVAGVAQADYPHRPITIIVPYGAGGTTDVMGRALADSLSRQLDQPVIVENKPGAGGSMGVLDMMNTKADGYRLTLAPVGIFRQPYVQETRYDPIRDLTYIASFMTYDFGFTVREDSPFQTIQDLVDYARENPGEITYGSPGQFSGNQVAMAMLEKDQDIKLTHVPFRGDADSTTALLGGHLQAAVVTNSILPHLRGGTVRILATSDNIPNPEFGGASTMQELGYDVYVPSPLGLAGPVDLPQDIVETLDKAVAAALDDPAFQGVAEKVGIRSLYMDNKTYSEFARTNFAKEKDIVGNLNLED